MVCNLLHLGFRSIRPEQSPLVLLCEGSRIGLSNQTESKGRENSQTLKAKSKVVWQGLSSGCMLHRLLVWECPRGTWCLIAAGQLESGDEVIGVTYEP